MTMETQIKVESEKKIKGTNPQKINPFLWFDDQAEEAVNFYTTIFKNSATKMVARYSEEGAKASGKPKDRL